MKRQIDFHAAHLRMVAGLPVIVIETVHPQTGRVEFRYFVEDRS